MGGGYDASFPKTDAPPPAPAPGQKERRAPKTAGSNQKENKDKPRRAYLDKQLRKTKICMYYLRGACQYNTNCDFAHTTSELQGLPDLSNTRLCKAFAQGNCSDPHCAFAHGEEELRSTNMFFKKTLCIWNEKGKCRNGDQCRFAHGNNELRYVSAVSPAGMRNTTTKEYGNAMTLVGTTPPNPQSNRALGTQGNALNQQELEELRELQQQNLLMQTHLQQQMQKTAVGEGGMGMAMTSPTIIASSEPMKVQSSLVDANLMVDTTPYDDSLQEQLDHLKQLMSVLSLKCNQIQTQVDSSGNLTTDQDVQLPPGLGQPFYL